MKIGIIGCGNIANSAHIPSYKNNPDVEIAYFCDIIEERAKKAAAEYGSGAAVTDYMDVLRDETVDAVSVCTPNSLHSVIAIDAMNHGKHVLCEKPVARTYAEALKMQEVQHKTGRTLNIGVVNRFNDNVNLIKKYIDGGRLGEVYHVYVSFRAHRSIPGLGGDFTDSRISGGGALIDWGVHFLDIVMYCCGDPKPRTVSGETFSRLGKDIPGYAFKSMWAGPPKPDGVYDVEDSVTALIRTEGPVISVNGAWAQNIGKDEMYIDFMGDKAGIRLNYGADFTLYTAENGALVEYTPQINKRNHFQTEIDAFVGSARTGTRLPSHIDTAIITARLMQAIYDSAGEHREMTL
ncbi:MAG: Gfo/Idh/MocA family protein [Saccharofermentanales bacterium]